MAGGAHVQHGLLETRNITLLESDLQLDHRAIFRWALEFPSCKNTVSSLVSGIGQSPPTFWDLEELLKGLGETPSSQQRADKQ